jgi:glutathione synthase/RimK-type ligase-like ATP-grasp enzyme
MTPRLVVIGNPNCRRVGFWRSAASRLGWGGFHHVSYHDALQGRFDPFPPNAVVRIETPGRDWETYKLLLKHGIEPAWQEGYPGLDHRAIDRLAYDRGWLVGPRQAHLGYLRLLNSLQANWQSQGATAMQSADEIGICFDKPACQARLARAGLPIPRPFGSPGGYEELRTTVREYGRVMVKLAHGSGAAGCVAIHHAAGRTRGITTVSQVSVAGERRLYHSKRPVHVKSESEVAELVDRFCVEKVQAEAWLPKARLNGRNFDLRIVTIGGVPRHTAVRCSTSVFTNLCLGGTRGSRSAVADRMGPAAWQSVRNVCASVASVFPGSFTLGIDVLIRPDWERCNVLEVNAFGDLLVNELDEGEDTYTAALAVWQRPSAPRFADMVASP